MSLLAQIITSLTLTSLEILFSSLPLSIGTETSCPSIKPYQPPPSDCPAIKLCQSYVPFNLSNYIIREEAGGSIAAESDSSSGTSTKTGTGSPVYTNTTVQIVMTCDDTLERRT